MSSVTKSKLEKQFMTTTLYKRSKQYFDIERLNRLESRLELQRRRPVTQNIYNPFDFKIEQSFISTQSKLTEKVQQELQKKKQRFYTEETEQTDTNSTNVAKGKTLDMNKMLARQYFEKQFTICKNEDQFWNFTTYQRPINHTIDFDKLMSNNKNQRKGSTDSGKCKSRVKTTVVNKIDVQKPDYLNKIYDKIAFDQSISKTLLDYKKYDVQKSQREKTPSPQKHLDRIMIGQNLTRKKTKSSLVEFCHGNNKWENPQMDVRLLKPNQYCLKFYNKKDKITDWTTLKRKTDMIDKRKRQILARKQIKDNKGQTCDQWFFRRFKGENI